VGTGHFVRILNDAGNTASPKYLGVEIATGDLGNGTYAAIWGTQHCGTAVSALGSEVAQTVLRCFVVTPATTSAATINWQWAC
jgi:hypothetical protein